MCIPGSGVSGAFPEPRDDNSGLPVWAVAVVASSVGITLLWLIAIVLLVLKSFLNLSLHYNIMSIHRLLSRYAVAAIKAAIAIQFLKPVLTLLLLAVTP